MAAIFLGMERQCLRKAQGPSRTRVFTESTVTLRRIPVITPDHCFSASTAVSGASMISCIFLQTLRKYATWDTRLIPSWRSVLVDALSDVECPVCPLGVRRFSHSNFLSWIVVVVQVQSRLDSFSRVSPKPSGAGADWWMDKFDLDVCLLSHVRALVPTPGGRYTSSPSICLLSHARRSEVSSV